MAHDRAPTSPRVTFYRVQSKSSQVLDNPPASVTPNIRMMGVTPSSERASACAGPIA